MKTISDADIADLYDVLGDPTRAAHLRAKLTDDPDAMTVDELADAINQVIDAVPDTGRGKHNDQCWKRHAVCLADRIREVLL
jgi:hypothetical protein